MYRGPTIESNWVLKDLLLMGAYPTSPSSYDDAGTTNVLSSILDQGVSCFVCLQAE